MPIDTSQLAALFKDAKTDTEREEACRDIVAAICDVYENPNTRLVYLTRVRRELASVGIAKRFLDLVVLSGEDYKWRDAQHEGRQLKRQLYEIRMKLVPQQFLRHAIKALRHEDPVVRLLGVQALTGRRAVEIFERGSIRPSEFPGWAIFEGQAKTKGRANEGYLIPVAHPDGVEPVAKAWREAALDLRKSGILSQRFPPRGKTARSMVKATPLNRSLHELALTHVRKEFGLSKTTLLRSGYATYTHEWFGRPMQRVQWIAVVLGHRTDVAGVLVPDRETAINYDAWDIAPVPSPLFPPAPAMPPMSALVPGAGEIAAIVGGPTPTPPPRPVAIDAADESDDADDWESEGDEDGSTEAQADDEQPDFHSQPPEAMPKPDPAPQAPVETPATPPQAPTPPPVAPAPVAQAQPAPQPVKVSPPPPAPAAPIPEQPQAAREALGKIATQVESARRKADALESTATKLSGEIAALTERLETVRADARASREGADRLAEALEVIAKFLPGGASLAAPALPAPAAGEGVPAPAAAPAAPPAPATPTASAAPAAAPAAVAAPAVAPASVPAAPPAAAPGRGRGSRKGRDNQTTVLKRLLEAGPMKRQDLLVGMGAGVTEGSFRVLLSRLTKKGEIARVIKNGVPWFELRSPASN